jgi:hypothetical protein
MAYNKPEITRLSCAVAVIQGSTKGDSHNDTQNNNQITVSAYEADE